VEQQPNCAACKILHGNKTPPQEPPCETCRPDVLAENTDALTIFSLVQGQWIMGPGGPVDINHLAVWEAIDRYGVKEKTATFGKVVTLSRWMLERIAGQRGNSG